MLHLLAGYMITLMIKITMLHVLSEHAAHLEAFVMALISGYKKRDNYGNL